MASISPLNLNPALMLQTSCELGKIYLSREAMYI